VFQSNCIVLLVSLCIVSHNWQYVDKEQAKAKPNMLDVTHYSILKSRGSPGLGVELLILIFHLFALCAGSDHFVFL
jgi:hypothetical protein